MPAALHRRFDPLLRPEQAEDLVALCARYGRYRTYGEEPIFSGLGDGLPARYDAVRNFIKTGGRSGGGESIATLASRTNYFRETYAYGDEIRAEGIQPFLRHEGFIEAARALFGRPIIEPAIVFANILVPGQELAIHTDVPEFRGVSRKTHPQWLCVAMHHSGLFEDWRMPIATGVSWFHDCAGGEFAFYPEGPSGSAVALPVHYNTAILLDTDSVFHGVDRVRETAAPVDVFRPGTQLEHVGNGRWTLRDGDRALATYDWRDLRFSVSWKAYCFADDAERRAWREQADGLSVEQIVQRMLGDLRDRGRIDGDAPTGHALVETLIDEYIHYPAAA